MAHSKATARLCELKNTPTRLDSRPMTKKKGKKFTTCQVELSVTSSKGKSVEENDSKGDIVVAMIMDMGIEKKSVRRSHMLEKNKKEISVDENSSNSK